MRTDAKIGFAIVGVLLAVLAVYAVVIPKHAKTASTVTLVKPSATDAPPTVVDPTNVQVPPDVAPVPVKIVPPVTPTAKPSGDPLAGLADKPVNPLTIGTGGDSLTDVTPVPTPNRGKPGRGESTAAKGRSTKTRSDAPKSDTVTRDYRVRSGQTLTSIASEVYGDPKLYKQILAVNPGLNPNRLKVGAKIQIPEPSAVHPHPGVVQASDMIVIRDTADAETPTIAGTTYEVQAGDSLYKIAKHHLGSGRRAEALYELNREVIGPDSTRLTRGMILRLPNADGLLTDASR